MRVRRRILLTGTLAALPVYRDALAQPVPLGGPVGYQRLGPGPLFSPGLPSLVLNFLSTPGTLDPRITFTRASVGTYFDATGTMQTAPANTPRWDYDPNTHVLKGLLLENSVTNVLLNSAALGTQSVTVTAQAYTLSFYGTGTVTLSGVSTAGPLAGTGAATRVALTFTPTAGSLTCTVTGSVTNAQLEAGPSPTSYIATAGTATARQPDQASLPTAAWFNANAGAAVAEFQTPNVPLLGTSNGIVRLDDTTDNNRAHVHITTNAAVFFGAAFVAAVSQINSSLGGSVNGTPQKAGFSYGGGLLWRGAQSGTLTSGVGSIVPLPATRMILGGANAVLTAWKLNGCLRRVRYWGRTLSNAELQGATT